MIILVDAYNVLKRDGRRDIDERARARFVDRMATYGRRKGHSMVVVFDGGGYSWPSEEKLRGVTVIYSGFRQRADDVIKDIIGSADGSRDMLVVSADREVCLFADECGVPSINPEDFMGYTREEPSSTVTRFAKGKQHVIKQSEEDNPELDALMQEAAQIVLYKADEPKSKDEGVGSKLDRKLMRVIKKL